MSKRAFRQVIHPGPRGTVRYLIDTIDGVTPVSGPRVSEYFAVRRPDDDPRFWVMTHLPTGLMVPWATRKYLHRSRQVAAVLEASGVKWSGRPNLKRAKEGLVLEMRNIPDTARSKRKVA